MKGSIGASMHTTNNNNSKRISILRELKTEWRSNPRDMNRIKKLQKLLNSKQNNKSKTWFM